MKPVNEPYPTPPQARWIVIPSLALLYLVMGLALWDGAFETALIAGLCLPVLLWITHTDLARFEIPDLASLALAGIGIGATLWQGEGIYLHASAAALVWFFLLILGEVYFRRKGVEGLGQGDAKLFAAATLLLGPWKLPELILIAALGGIIAHLIAKPKEGVPFGPFICFAIFVLVFLDPVFL